MYCCRCGVEMPVQAKYCMECGAASAKAEASGWRKMLTRPRNKVKIAGVCAAFAIYFDVDVTLIRVLWLAMCLWPVPLFGVIAYFIAWIAIPREEIAATGQPRQFSAPASH